MKRKCVMIVSAMIMIVACGCSNTSNSNNSPSPSNSIETHEVDERVYQFQNEFMDGISKLQNQMAQYQSAYRFQRYGEMEMLKGELRRTISEIANAALHIQLIDSEYAVPYIDKANELQEAYNNDIEFYFSRRL